MAVITRAQKLKNDRANNTASIAETSTAIKENKSKEETGVVEFLPPSPTDSTGPEFNPRQPLRQEVLHAARQGVDHPPTVVPHGFQNPHVRCYRNAIVVMLMCTDRFVSWIEHWHMSRSHISNTTPHEPRLLDVLDQLRRAYWSNEHDRASRTDKAMAVFWKYIFDIPEDDLFGRPMWGIQRKERQEDASEFLDYILRVIDIELAYMDENK